MVIVTRDARFPRCTPRRPALWAAADPRGRDLASGSRQSRETRRYRCSAARSPARTAARSSTRRAVSIIDGSSAARPCPSAGYEAKNAHRSIASTASMTNHARCPTGNHCRKLGGSRSSCSRSQATKFLPHRRIVPASPDGTPLYATASVRSDSERAQCQHDRFAPAVTRVLEAGASAYDGPSLG